MLAGGEVEKEEEKEKEEEGEEEEGEEYFGQGSRTANDGLFQCLHLAEGLHLLLSLPRQISLSHSLPGEKKINTHLCIKPFRWHRQHGGNPGRTIFRQL